MKIFTNKHYCLFHNLLSLFSLTFNVVNQAGLEQLNIFFNRFDCIKCYVSLVKIDSITVISTHWAWTKFGVKKMDREWDTYSIKLHIHTNILSQKPKNSVGKFLSYGIFLNFVYHNLYLAHVLQRIWFFNEINTSEEIE